MEKNINLRVFRRNNKNIIILWNNGLLEEKYLKNINVYLVGSDGVESPLSFDRFIPDDPSKFSKDIDGVIISHSVNNLKIEKVYNIRIIFGNKDDLKIVTKEVLSGLNHFEKPEIPSGEIHVMGYDYAINKWVPLPIDKRLIGDVNGKPH